MWACSPPWWGIWRVFAGRTGGEEFPCWKVVAAELLSYTSSSQNRQPRRPRLMTWWFPVRSQLDWPSGLPFFCFVLFSSLGSCIFPCWWLWPWNFELLQILSQQSDLCNIPFLTRPQPAFWATWGQVRYQSRALDAWSADARAAAYVRARACQPTARPAETGRESPSSFGLLPSSRDVPLLPGLRSCAGSRLGPWNWRWVWPLGQPAA